MAVDISIIVPCKGHSVELRHCLEGLASQKTAASYEVIVVNGDIHRTLQEITAQFSFAHLVESGAPLLPGAARNRGVEYARAARLGFIDADCVPQNDWVDEAVRALEQNCVLAGGAVLDLYAFNLIASADNRLQFVDFPRGRPAGLGQYFPACNMTIRKDTFSEGGGFREDLEAGEDVLFTSRISEQWKDRVCFIPSLVVQHAGRVELRGFLEHQRKFGYYRGLLGLRTSRSHEWLSARRYLNWITAIRRLGYIFLRVLQWNILDLPRFILQLPFLLAGLIWWTMGYYEGVDRKTSK